MVERGLYAASAPPSSLNLKTTDVCPTLFPETASLVRYVASGSLGAWRMRSRAPASAASLAGMLAPGAPASAEGASSRAMAMPLPPPPEVGPLEREQPVAPAALSEHAMTKKVRDAIIHQPMLLDRRDVRPLAHHQ